MKPVYFRCSTSRKFWSLVATNENLSRVKSSAKLLLLFYEEIE